MSERKTNEPILEWVDDGTAYLKQGSYSTRSGSQENLPTFLLHWDEHQTFLSRPAWHLTSYLPGITNHLGDFNSIYVAKVMAEKFMRKWLKQNRMKGGTNE